MTNKRAGANSKQFHRGAYQTKKKRFFFFAPIARKITIGIVFVSVVAVLCNIINVFYFPPDKVAKSTLEKMAKDYYENYYYDKISSSIPDGKNLEETIKESETKGFPPVLLRHLLVFDNKRNAKYAQDFDTKSFYCDKNNTSVKFYPIAPYGKTDYKVSYSLSCKNK